MEVKTAEFLKSSAHPKECPPADRPEYAFIGRSNVGKSSLINMLTNRKGLAKISSTPGKTQLINHFMIDEGREQTGDGTSWYLVDLPGFGYAKVSKKSRVKWQRTSEQFLTGRPNLMCVMMLLDSRHPPVDDESASTRYNLNIKFATFWPCRDFHDVFSRLASDVIRSTSEAIGLARWVFHC